ncbi:MAG: c-type cytochrome [Planctomycetales bacterium]|nr:c-type cytochrome [Planctomycetales bacterium]
MFPNIKRSWLTQCFCFLSYLAGWGYSQNDISIDLEELEYIPGLIGHYATEQIQFQRLDDALSFDWRVHSPDARITDGSKFSVTWQGGLQIRADGNYRLSFYGSGKCEILLDGKSVLIHDSITTSWTTSELLTLQFGIHSLVVKVTNSQQLGLFWEGPQFALEPLTSLHIVHANPDYFDATPEVAASRLNDQFDRGQQLVRNSKCSACHDLTDGSSPVPAPALTNLADNLNPHWLVEHLMASVDTVSDGPHNRNMPFYGLSRSDAEAVTSALLANSEPPSDLPHWRQELAEMQRKRKKNDPEIRVSPSEKSGRVLFATSGCLACHIHSAIMPASNMAVGASAIDLSQIANKRTRSFFARWLNNPAEVNSQHQMPVFEFDAIEHLDLIAFLTTGSANPQLVNNQTPFELGGSEQIDRGRQLIAELHCVACHELPRSIQATPNKRVRLQATSKIAMAGCINGASAERQRTFQVYLSENDKSAVESYLRDAAPNHRQIASAEQLLEQHNCLACHAYNLNSGIVSQFPDLLKAVPGLATEMPLLSPPALTSVGDKLHDSALKTAIQRSGPARRPWLRIQMPKFRLSSREIDSLAEYFIARDRIPEGKQPVSVVLDRGAELAAARLVTSEGLGCQSCHQIGSNAPPIVAPGAHGTNLTMAGKNIRESWFRRWVHNPARIVPRMEMPAIQTPVKGVLNDSLEEQLSALWQVLNTPGFEPPRPAPVRVVRSFNSPDLKQFGHIMTDVLESGEQKYLRPLIFGLPNRHNLLVDLERGTLRDWWIGDTARQYTRGKSWYWEQGNDSLVSGLDSLERYELCDAQGNIWVPRPVAQFVMELDQLDFENGRRMLGRIHFAFGDQERTLALEYEADGIGPDAVLTTHMTGLRAGEFLRIATGAQLTPTSNATLEGALDRDSGLQISAADRACNISLSASDKRQFEIRPALSGDSVAWSSRYQTRFVPDEFPIVAVEPYVQPAVELKCVPGFEAWQMALPPDEMPTAMAWDDRGRMYIASLKGRVLKIDESQPEKYVPISDEFPAPYGLYFGADGLDVLTKTALYRLTENESPTEIRDSRVLVDGWGYTADYHDWAVGLVKDETGNYFMALPCQQDDRSEAAAYLRGHALKLVPYESQEEPRSYRIEPWAAGLRFPMGIVLTDSGDLFTTDNQGNYNPFNELNHLQYGKRYGFINKLENKEGFAPPFESPAINLPHPWTRSVNGICILKTPTALKQVGESNHFGPFEGHIIGCEMNGRSLVRMSLQQVNGQYQGCAYDFSRPIIDNSEPTFEGPICCAVSPSGDLYIGNLHDSGWGGGQNTGSIVRLTPRDQIPLGIAEVRATPDGFLIDFTQPVDPLAATSKENYQLRSYRRISTPAYGGDDQEQRQEQIAEIELAGEKQVKLKLGANLRDDSVYEIYVSVIGDSGVTPFPNQAHYTMRSVPRKQ